MRLADLLPVGAIPSAVRRERQKLRQCSGIRFRSFLGKLIGNVLHADQYTRAACDSISRIVVMLSALGNSVLNWAIPSAVVESSSLCRATRSCAASFWLISSRAIRNADPDECAVPWDLRSLLSEGRTGPVTARTLPSRSSMSESHVLVREPPEGCQGNHPIGADDNQSLQAVPYAWKARVAAIRPNSIQQDEVTTVYADLDAVAEKGHDTMTRHNQFSVELWDCESWRTFSVAAIGARISCGG